MAAQPTLPADHPSFLNRHPVAAYFTLTFTISWLGAFLVATPHLLRRESLPRLTGILMFPAMLAGPSLSGLFLTRLIDGQSGLRDLFSRMFKYRAGRWYAVLLIPPALVLIILLLLKAFVSAAFTPNFFLFGIFFGVPAGLLEEIGWTGFAFPKMSSWQNPLATAILLGLLWGLWHLPVIDFLGAATPHRSWWLPFALAFIAAMTAMRVVICWLYANTKSVLLAQLLHISSTGSLVIFSAPGLTPAQEVFWYSLYAGALWLTVAFISRLFTTRLTTRQ